MLELKRITKIYPAGGFNVEALKGIDLTFRDSEFVSILGPSGCGKTTMLNIIGGLDQYTDGDLLINGISTKQYKDRDWDCYRNHSIGFVFQTYNLIPHQSVLQNVELALTLSGVGRKERRKRAIEALEKVGLKSQIKKKPSQMSGGQMQRVAIARALVNNPDIILADEPTGALDTETSVQVMDILKEISKDRLVIMVTHNPELAQKYSTRIVNMLDGVITGDSKPLSEEEIQNYNNKSKDAKLERKKMPSMSFFTSFMLSLKNLFTKKGRTILTSFAGSIGIIGIALIYSVSQGTTLFINNVQESTLTSYPLTIQSESYDISSLLSVFMGKAESIDQHENDAIYQKAMMYNMMNEYNSLESKKNDLKSFKEFIENELKDEDSDLSNALSGIQYTYDAQLTVYTKNASDNIIKSDVEDLTMKLMKEYFGMDMSSLKSMSSKYSLSSTTSTSKQLWQELLPGKDGSLINDVIKNQYDIVYGSWPNSYDEIVLFVDENNEIDDTSLYALGLMSEEEIDDVMKAALNKTTVEYTLHSWSYEEICNKDFKVILSSDAYKLDAESGLYKDLTETEAGLKYLYDNALDLHVVGILKPSDNYVSSSSGNSGIGYTSELTKYIIEKAQESDAVKAQLDSPKTDIFTGLQFKDTSTNISDTDKSNYFIEYIKGLNDDEKSKLYEKIMSIPPEEQIEEYLKQTLGSLNRDAMEVMIVQAMTEQTGMDQDTIAQYLASMSDEELNDMISNSIREKYISEYSQKALAQLSQLTKEQKASMLDELEKTLTEQQNASYYETVLEFSDSTYEDNLINLGLVSLDNPSSINLYASTFENKDVIENVIAKYNENVDSLSEISYTDYVGLIMSSVTTIIDAIGYVLIAFVSVSLIVSSIMIGVITLISVQERTKEIGILRAIGASKKNVSSMFNAETLIIGFTSGLLGVLITYLLIIPINIILHSLTDLNNLSAVLPWQFAVVLVLISMLLTLIAGVIPSMSAAKKDPVIALRTE